MVICDCKLSIQEMEAGGSEVQWHPQLLSESSKPAWATRNLISRREVTVNSDILSARPAASEQTQE